MLDISRIRAITLDLDDTLWPIWPTIARAEKVLIEWLLTVAPGASALLASPDTSRMLRAQVASAHAHLSHDLTVLRRETIRAALRQAGEDESLTDQGFDVFFAERQRVELFDDAIAALEFLSARHPVVALSNGNADLQAIGIGRYFRASISAREFGIAKPDPRIFHEAARVLDLPPAAVLHIGDDATLDAHGALGAGMQAAWLNRGDAAWPHAVAPPATVRDLAALCRLLG
ncbi:MAG: HAD-IA family hydrolase [Diaphorobacter nitroreducens]|uniref:HAD family hydrolase n=1 Tax=Diaphorobacter TaxID=238749 RepID=UPI001C731C05|nr:MULTISPECIES: HAD-IA family hydrolase [Diaphorobacter]MDU7586201.1 HAD-IA family hydrolase [Acidovorax sp.]QYY24315.1 HAD-IA family hydrolase [Diaphorobacter sp. MNS-0]